MRGCPRSTSFLFSNKQKKSQFLLNLLLMNRRCEMLLTKHRPRYLPLLILGACFLLFNYGSHAGFLNPFLNPKLSKAPRFPSSQLYQITSTIKLDNISGYIGAFGDFDSDK
jgi:hypothetical protein